MPRLLATFVLSLCVAARADAGSALPENAPMPARSAPAETPAAGASPAAPVSGPSYAVYWGRSFRPGDVLLCKEHDSTSFSTWIPGGSTIPGAGERQEIDTVYRERVIRVDASGDPIELRVHVQSATGRDTGSSPMRTLTTAHSDLLVITAPTFSIKRVGGGRIPASEQDLWGLVFSDSGGDALPTMSGPTLPSALQVGQTFSVPLPNIVDMGNGLAMKTGGALETTVTGKRLVSGVPCLTLKSQMGLKTAAPVPTGDKSMRMSSVTLALGMDSAVPTVSDEPIPLEDIRITFSARATVTTSGLTVPMDIGGETRQDVTILQFVPAH